MVCRTSWKEFSEWWIENWISRLQYFRDQAAQESWLCDSQPARWIRSEPRKASWEEQSASEYYRLDRERKEVGNDLSSSFHRWGVRCFSESDPRFGRILIQFCVISKRLSVQASSIVGRLADTLPAWGWLSANFRNHTTNPAMWRGLWLGWYAFGLQPIRAVGSESKVPSPSTTSQEICLISVICG